MWSRNMIFDLFSVPWRFGCGLQLDAGLCLGSTRAALYTTRYNTTENDDITFVIPSHFYMDFCGINAVTSRTTEMDIVGYIA